jgi:glycosyltransferase involved in cell wall biosynthesis
MTGAPTRISPPMKRAIILGRINGVGLDRDAAMLAEAMAARGIDTHCPPWKNPLAALSGRSTADAAIHLERVAPAWWRFKAPLHFLIPNQERFPKRLLGKLRRIDSVLCKSRHAAEIFSEFHPRVRFIGFTSPDRLLADSQPDFHRFLHLAGRSTLKNTELLLALWSRHPEWPTLTLVQHPENAPSQVPPNVNLISRYLPDDELRALQNTCGIHLCPSLSEGWGHYIVEAMSCRALVLTTDAPPMNEIVSPERGLLVPVVRKEPRHLGWNFHVDPNALEAVIESALAMPESEKLALGVAARRWFEENQREFSARLAEAMDA